MTEVERQELEGLTKQKILSTSLELFAEHGFKGTSMRSLAHRAQVNLSSINYHFQSKENLYLEVIKYSYLKIDQSIKESVHEFSESSELFCIRVYDLMLQEAAMLSNTFRLFISEEGNPCSTLSEQPEFSGPPGASEMMKVLKKERPSLSDEDLVWLIRSCLSIIIHSVLIATHCNSTQYQNSPFKRNATQIREDVKRSIRALLKSIDRAE